jgi:hypothetical protein
MVLKLLMLAAYTTSIQKSAAHLALMTCFKYLSKSFRPIKETDKVN